MWPNTRLLDLVKIDCPIVLAPMAGAMDSALAIAAAQGGALGSLPCAMLTGDQIRAEVEKFRRETNRPLNLNFFCHVPPAYDEQRERAWRGVLTPYYREFGIDPAGIVAGPGRAPFDARLCALVEEVKPEVVSFHFGLPEQGLLARVRAAGCVVLSSATTVAEARWLEQGGVDAVIAQGVEAGGHRGMFLTDDIASQVGTFALVPQIVDAVRVPVIASGGVADARGIAAAFMLGACGVQIGTAYLHCPEARISPMHRAALSGARDDGTVLTNLFTGRPARGIVNRVMREFGPLNSRAPAFPLATGAIAPLRARAEAQGSGEFSPLWAGQAAALASARPATQMTQELARDALALLKGGR